MTVDLLGLMVGTLLTLMVLSYIIGDNPFYRLALHLFIGTTVGYGLAVTVVTVLVQTVFPALQSNPDEQARTVFPLVLGLLLLFKGFPRWAGWGNLSTAFLVGVGSAVAVSGALLGTILPQSAAVGAPGPWSILLFVGTVGTLLAFTFTVPRRPAIQRLWNWTLGLWGRVGRLFLLAALGAAFATALISSLTVLVGRVYAVVMGLQQLLPLVR
ncbi:MAG: hypothetical protein RML46_02670 [Anaerolineae bacterium]|nr:hypothetical protein [Anaerolineae bacterium]MDW8067799.1 hypothetical protein [Anaerolineae bacterium]